MLTLVVAAVLFYIHASRPEILHDVIEKIVSDTIHEYMPATSIASLLLPDYSFEMPVPAPYKNQNCTYVVLKLFIIGLA